MKRNLYALNVCNWDANDYFEFVNADRSCNPAQTAMLLFPDRESAEKYATTIDCDSDSYNECFLHCGELEEKDILAMTGYETMGDFDLALNDTYLSDPTRKTYGYDEKEQVAQYIVDVLDGMGESIDCANYDFDKTLEGAILVVWSWHKYIGYARKCLDVRYGLYGETEEFLTKADKTFVPQVDVVMTKEEAEAYQGADLEEVLREKLLADKEWKWTNPGKVENLINQL